MPVELVKAPFVKIFGVPQVIPSVIDQFIEEHDLIDLAAEEGTPIERLQQEAMFASGESDADLISEFAGRFCYRAWKSGRGRDEYIENVISERHGNVLAHSNFNFIITGVSRSLTHELVRHHVGTNPSQESQRFVTAEGGEIEVIGYKAMRAVVPPLILANHQRQLDNGADSNWLSIFEKGFDQALGNYDWWLQILKANLPPEMPPTLRKKRANEAARAFLPNACETRLVWTMNLRAARHVIERRGDVHADLEIRRLACAFVPELKRYAPAAFADAEVYTADDGFEAVRVDHYGV